MKKWLKAKSLVILIGIVMIVVMVVVGVYFFNFGGGKLSGDTGTWGEFGDYVGGTLNPMLAFFSFLALCYTIHLQNKQLQRTDEQLAQNKLALEQNAKALELNNQELKNSTEQLQLSAKAQLEMEKTQRIQQFEGLFTFMLGMLSKCHDIINDKQINALNYIGENIDPSIYIFKDSNRWLRESVELVALFMHLYQILKLIHNQDDIFFPPNNKKQYANIVRAGLDNNTLQLLFLNCIKNNITNDSFDEFADLLEEFEFFEHLRLEMPTHYGVRKNLIYLSGFYSKKVYGDGKNIKRALGVLIGRRVANGVFSLSFEADREELIIKKINSSHPPQIVSMKELIGIYHQYYPTEALGVINRMETGIQINQLEFVFNQENEVRLIFLPLDGQCRVMINSLEVDMTFSYERD